MIAGSRTATARAGLARQPSQHPCQPAI